MDTNTEKEKILMKNNVIVKARYNITTAENKIFQLLLYRFQKSSKDTLVCKITKSDFQNLLNKDSYKTTKGISNILVSLRKSDIWFMKDKQWGNFGFINGFTYDEETEIFTIKADLEIYELLHNYLKNYTPINMSIFFSFKSYYAQRFYELLRLWSNTKKIINYKIDELKELLMLEGQYELYADFKRRVIVPAVKELNEKGLMKVEFKENKISRRVVSIDFIVSDNDKRKYFQDKQIDENLNKLDNKKLNKYDNNKTLMFNDYDQRTYDYEDLEKKLLGWDNEN